MKAIDWINHLNMSRHPEGGYYKEIFRSEKLIDNDKSAMTSIYYLLENEDKSAFHRLTSPEVWYYHAGYPLMLHVIHPDGRLVTHLMTADFSGEQQVAIEPGCWFAAEFTFDDFELGTFDRLSKLYPDHEDLLKRLCQ